MSDVVDVGTTTATEVPVETPSPANDPAPADPGETVEASHGAGTPAVSEPVVAPVQPEDPGEIAPSASHGAGSPVIETPKEVPQQPAQATHAPAPLSIKDRAYAALEKIRFNKRRKLDKIVVLAKEKGSITNDDVQLHVRVSDTTATNYLNALVVQGVLKRVGSAAHAVYEAL